MAETGDVKVVATNRRARRDYEILATYEAGIVLRGSEVKSLRESHVQLTDTYARVIGNEAWIIGLHIGTYSHDAGFSQPSVERDRKLLMHRDEIDRLRARLDQDRLSLVPLSLYFKGGRAKVELGLGRGRKNYDKRQVIAERDADMDARRELARRDRH
jgi:SsrA-binding protein